MYWLVVAILAAFVCGVTIGWYIRDGFVPKKYEPFVFGALSEGPEVRWLGPEVSEQGERFQEALRADAEAVVRKHRYVPSGREHSLSDDCWCEPEVLDVS